MAVFSGRRELNSAWAFGLFVALTSAWTSRPSAVLMSVWASRPLVALPSAWTSRPSAVLMSYLASGPSIVYMLISAWTSELFVVSMSDRTGQTAGTHGSVMRRLALLANLLLVRPKPLAKLMLINCLQPSLQRFTSNCNAEVIDHGQTCDVPRVGHDCHHGHKHASCVTHKS